MPFRSRVPAWKKERIREYRKHPTPSEARMWERLRGGALGEKFRRQEPILGYIVDFYCPRSKLAVEIDGSSHDGRSEYDQYRDGVLLDHGIRTLRIPSRLVMTHLDLAVGMVVSQLDAW